MVLYPQRFQQQQRQHQQRRQRQHQQRREYKRQQHSGRQASITAELNSRTAVYQASE
jgi:hypothetical protein